MTKTEKERLQYLFAQLLEGDTDKENSKILFALIDKEKDNAELEAMLEELIAAEPEQQNYDGARWDHTVRDILNKPQGEVKKSFDGEGKVDTKVIPIPRGTRWLWIASVAAMFIIAVSIWFVIQGDNKSIIQTEYAQQKKVALPDETEIILNSKSNIKYLKQWKNGQRREVWLKGEAFFKVRHINTDTNSINSEERFIVHTDLADIEVLGTVFNVRERRGKTEIVLEQGKIKVSFIKSAEPDIIMQPGQIVTITAENKKAVTNTIKPEEYTAWTQKKLVLTDASFQPIVEYMEDNFGKRIILTDPQLANRKVEGTFKIDNMEDALLVLSKALNVNITQKGDTLIFTPQ